MRLFASRKAGHSRFENRRGIILVFVLWSIVLLSSLVMATSVSFRGFAGVIAIDRDKAKMDGLLTAGLEAAVANLIRREPNDYRMPDEVRLRLPEGEVRARMSDEQGRIDINKALAPLLTALFNAVGMPDAQRNAQVLVNWRNRNLPPQASADPKQNPPDAQKKPQEPQMPVVTFDDVHQLSQVPDFDAGFIPALIPLTTVFGSGAINPLTASSEVLLALPNANNARVSQLVDLREIQPLEQKQIENILGSSSAAFTEIAANSAIRVELAAELNDGYAARATAVIKTSPTDVQPYHVLAWASHTIFQR